VEALNEYFRVRVSQDVRRRLSFCYIALEESTNRIAGYYTLSASGVALGTVPEAVAKRLPRYPMIPAVRIGRLAIDRDFQGRRLGGALLFDAIDRTCTSGIAAFAVVVDAKDDIAVAFYEHHGFQRFGEMNRTLFLPIGDALKRRVEQRS
jgi:ribosomal protein S18 acetylase RimI-like enzyme